MKTSDRLPRNFSRQATAALGKFFERGKTAVGMLKDGQVDAALDMLQERTEAFHNFRVADALVKNSGSHPEEVEMELKVLWVEIAKIDCELRELLEFEFENVKTELRNIAQSKAKIGKYRSGYNEKVNFEYSI